MDAPIPAPMRIASGRSSLLPSRAIAARTALTRR